jgi:hypothetical protein
VNGVRGNQSGLSALAVLYRLISDLSLDWLNNVDCVMELTGRRVVLMFFLKEIYCSDSIYRVYKDKLQNSSCNQFH